MATIQLDGLTKRFGATTAVDHISFTAESGTITGFLGPNGAGKTTTLRMLLGLVEATAGTAMIDGRAYSELAQLTAITILFASLQAPRDGRLRHRYRLPSS